MTLGIITLVRSMGAIENPTLSILLHLQKLQKYVFLFMEIVAFSSDGAMYLQLAELLAPVFVERRKKLHHWFYGEGNHS